MKVETSTCTLSGQSLHRLVLHPDAPPIGSLVFFHGQGDFIDRYPPVLAPFVDAGYRCILTDLPGHGRSEGRRGLVPGLNFIDQLLKHSLMDQPSPQLIAGHSMGGLMALRLYLKHSNRFSAAWFSSPLLDPMRQAKAWMRFSLPLIAGLIPWLTVGTGVRSEDCTDHEGGRSDDELAPLYHSRISIGWGRDLRDASEDVATVFPKLSGNTPILFTQGDLDSICPAEILKERLARIDNPLITYAEIESARHEPFSGSTFDNFHTALRNWISTLNQTPLP